MSTSLLPQCESWRSNSWDLSQLNQLFAHHGSKPVLPSENWLSIWRLSMSFLMQYHGSLIAVAFLWILKSEAVFLPCYFSQVSLAVLSLLYSIYGLNLCWTVILRKSFDPQVSFYVCFLLCFYIWLYLFIFFFLLLTENMLGETSQAFIKSAVLHWGCEEIPVLGRETEGSQWTETKQHHGY